MIFRVADYGQPLAKGSVTQRLATLVFLGVTVLGANAAASPPSGTSVVVFIDFSGSIQSASRAAYRRELERDILPVLVPGDRIVIAAIHDKTLTAFRPLAEATSGSSRTPRRKLPALVRSSSAIEELRAEEGVDMTTSGERWHSISEIDRKVYHDDPRCPEGLGVEPAHRRVGTEGRRKCEHCAQHRGLEA